MVLDFQLKSFRSAHQPARDLRREMIAETAAFLNWALAEERRLPRIPRRRVDKGGFTLLMLQPSARALAYHWWSRVLESDDES